MVKKLSIGDLRHADAALQAADWMEAYRRYSMLYNGSEDNANVHVGLGFALYKLDRFEEASRHFADACLRRPEPHWQMFHIDCLLQIDALLAAGVLYQCLVSKHPETRQVMVQNGISVRAEAAVRMATGVDVSDGSTPKPDRSKQANIETALVADLLRSGNSVAAASSGDESVDRYPWSPGLLLNVGLAHKRLGDFDKAMALYLRAAVVDPTGANLCANLGNLLLEAGKVPEAMRFLEASAIGIPDAGIVWSNLAAAYNHLGVLPVEAEFAARKAINLRNSSPSAYLNAYRLLGSALSRQGRGREALEAFTAGVDPEDDASFTAPLITMIMSDDEDVVSVSEAHKEYGRIISSMVEPRARRPRSGRMPNAITLGFVSADFRAHSVSYFALPLLEGLHKLGHRLVAYYNNGREDEISEHYKLLVDAWRPIKGLPDENVADLIEQDEIDVLIDLAGHTQGARLPVFVQTSAPLTVTWLGHPATTGLDGMDARFTDWVSDPEGQEEHYTERLYRLPDIFCVYRPLIKQPNERHSEKYLPQPSPSLTNGYITFGSCNTLGKYSDTTIRVWAKVLESVPGSKLYVEAPGLQAIALQRSLAVRFAEHGIGPDRLILQARDNSLQYLIYNKFDVALDCFPCNGGTTSFDVLWMGVPLVTLRSDRFAGRMGAAVLTAIDRQEWVADTESEFVAIAKKLVSDVDELNEMRQQQRFRVEASPLMDEPRFSKDFVNVLRAAWEDQS